MQAGDDKLWVLTIIILYAKEGLISDVLAQVEPSDEDLRGILGDAGVACMSDMFINLLRRINDKDEQKGAVEEGVHALFHAKKTEYLDPLLTALKNNPFLDPEVKDRAVKGAFIYASWYPKDKRALSYAGAYYDHPAVLARDYSTALYNSYLNGGSERKVFNLLLEEADHGDLEAVQRHPDWNRMPDEFKEAIKGAPGTDKPAGTRIKHNIQVAEKAGELFKEDIAGLGIIEPLADVISGYITREPPIRAKKTSKQTTSDVTSTSTGVEGSTGIGGEEEGAGKK